MPSTDKSPLDSTGLHQNISTMAMTNLTKMILNAVNQTATLTNNQSHPMESVAVTPNVTASVVANSSAASSSLIEQILPKKGSAEEEHSFSMAIFFVLAVIGRSSFLFPLKLL
jgi:hypothetical protein